MPRHALITHTPHNDWPAWSTSPQEYPLDTITLMSHSQGTMIAMAATTLCKKRAPDALFVMNSPYAMDDKMTDALSCGGERPTAQARVNTFRNIANRSSRTNAFSPNR